MRNKEIVIRIDGGLASQMFAYSFYYFVESKGYQPQFDLSWYRRFGTDKYLLKKVFNLEAKEYENHKKYGSYNLGSVIAKSLRKTKLLNILILCRIVPKIYYTVKPYYFGYRFSLDSIDYILEQERGIYFWGPWFFFSYVEENEDVFRKQFKFPQIVDKKNSVLVESINRTNSVSLHIRRGDYEKYPRVFQCLGEQYYKNAIKIINGSVSNPVYYIFADDNMLAKKFMRSILIDDNHTVYVSGNKGDNAYIDMYLMSQCKHNIVANSGFSMWAAFLNDNKDKIVITPQKYFTNKFCVDNQADLYRVPNRKWIKLSDS